MKLVGSVDDQLVFFQRAGKMLGKDIQRTFIHIQKLTEIVAILNAVKVVGKLKILQIRNPGDIHLNDGRLQCKKHEAPSSLVNMRKYSVSTVP